MRIVLSALIWLCLTACATVEPPAGLLGAYRLDDGRTVSIRRSPEGSLRYRLLETGRSGRLYRKTDSVFESGPGFTAREPVELVVRFRADAGTETAPALEWNRRGEAPRTARRIGTDRPVSFVSGDTRLVGRLQLPEGPPPYPAVVLVHGSGDAAATEWFYNNDFFVANGIAALTYDKRGSGRSGGAFTFDFGLLAQDVSAAVDFLGGVAEIDGGRIGLAAYSQGGWVAPLAASGNRRVKFVVVSYGMIESPAEEARLEMLQRVIDAGFGEAELAAADALIRASIDVVASGLEDGWDRFAALRRQHAGAAWRGALDGTPVDQMLTWPKFLVKLVGRRRLPDGLPWYYDSGKLLEHADVPMAWFLGGRDRSAPNEQTIARLESMIEAGKPYALVVYPDADHGMLLFDERDGERVYRGYAPAYFRSEVDAIRRLAE